MCRLYRVGQRDGHWRRNGRLGRDGLRAAVETAMRGESRAKRAAGMLAMLRAGELAGLPLLSGSAVRAAGSGRRVVLRGLILLGLRVLLRRDVLLGRLILTTLDVLFRRVLPCPAALAVAL